MTPPCRSAATAAINELGLKKLQVPVHVADLMAMYDVQIVCGWPPDADTYICIVGCDSYIELGHFDVNVDYLAMIQSVAPTHTP